MPFKYYGGVHPEYEKTAAKSPVRPIAPPKEVVLPMVQHIGAPNQPVVKVGDTVKMGQLIGRRGETLDAIQQLTNYVVNRDRDKRVRIHVDAENYREKREQSLEHLARKVAAKVVKYRRSVTLEPMNAYERHVIHTALQDVEHVTTFSTGTEPNRRVVVSYEK